MDLINGMNHQSMPKNNIENNHKLTRRKYLFFIVSLLLRL